MPWDRRAAIGIADDEVEAVGLEVGELNAGVAGSDVEVIFGAEAE